MATLPMGGCVTPVSIMRYVWDPLGLHLNPKDLNRARNGQFTKGRLRDLSEYHAKCKGSIGASFEPKISKIGQEMAELWQNCQQEVA